MAQTVKSDIRELSIAIVINLVLLVFSIYFAVTLFGGASLFLWIVSSIWTFNIGATLVKIGKLSSSL